MTGICLCDELTGTAPGNKPIPPQPPPPPPPPPLLLFAPPMSSPKPPTEPPRGYARAPALG